MSATYPDGIDSFPPIVDGVTELIAELWNHVQDADVAIQTELGTNPAGIATDVKTRLDDALPINVKDHGAKGDNSTDDYDAIQAAIDVAIENERWVYIPAGTYRVSQGLKFFPNESGLNKQCPGLYGDTRGPDAGGAGSSIIAPHSTWSGEDWLLTVKGDANNTVANFAVRDIYFCGDWVDGVKGIYVCKGAFIFFETVLLAQLEAGLKLEGIWDSVFENVELRSCGNAAKAYAGLRIQPLDEGGRFCNNLHFLSCIFEAPRFRMVEVINTWKVHFVTCKFHALSVGMPGGDLGCDYPHTYLAGTETYNTVFTSCTFQGTGRDESGHGGSATQSAEGLYLDEIAGDHGPHSVIVEGCHFQFWGLYAINAACSRNLRISNSTFGNTKNSLENIGGSVFLGSDAKYSYYSANNYSYDDTTVTDIDAANNKNIVIEYETTGARVWHTMRIDKVNGMTRLHRRTADGGGGSRTVLALEYSPSDIVVADDGVNLDYKTLNDADILTSYASSQMKARVIANGNETGDYQLNVRYNGSLARAFLIDGVKNATFIGPSSILPAPQSNRFMRYFNDFTSKYDLMIGAAEDWVLTTERDAGADAAESAVIVDNSVRGYMKLTNNDADDDAVSLQFTGTGGARAFVKQDPNRPNVYWETWIRLGNATECDVFFGLCVKDTTLTGGASDPLPASTGYVGFVKDDLDTNWDFVSRSATGETRRDAVKTATTEWMRLGFVTTTNTSIQAYVNGAAVGEAITTNIYTGVMAPSIALRNGKAEALFVEIDVLEIVQTR